MKSTRSVILALVLMIVVAALYRIIPNRPPNFAPQLAIAIFGGAIFIKNKKWAFSLPLVSMILSDLLYQALYTTGNASIPGFYEGQWQNYLLIGALVAFGFLMKKINVVNIAISSVAASATFFVLSNFVVWAGWQGTRGLNRPRTFDGLMMTYVDGLPFYWNSLVSTLLFSGVLFGGWYLLTRKHARTIAA